MQEVFLHYLFEHQLIQNKEFEIISPGQKNLDAGPDFFNAKIRIANVIWAGNVEIHIKSSDWKRHGHDKDKSYDNIILHLVYQHDQEIYATEGYHIPTFEIKFDSKIYESYKTLLNTESWIHCEDKIQQVDSITKISYIESLSINRLERKSKFFEELLSFNNNNWESSFYQAIAKGFGGKINAVPFELLAKSIPLTILTKHQNNVFQIEALLFGQAGFLDDTYAEDSYYMDLQKEYLYLKNKYQLESIRTELWKFSKIRPYNFPTIKIAFFTQLISNYHSLLSKILDCSSTEEVSQIITLQANTYWDTHYRFGKTSKKLIKKLGQSSKQHLLINTIIPFLYIYAQETGQESVKEKCLDWYINLKPEENNILEKWENLGFENTNAMHSQGLIELKNEKCDKHRCLDCRFAHKILTLSWNE